MSWAERYIGLPYVEDGRGPDGFDCWGLTRKVLAEVFHVELPAYENSGNREERLALISAVDAAGGYTRVDEPREGAIVLAQTGNRRSHVGLCIDGERMLHAQPGVGACIARLDSPQWRNAIRGFYLPPRRPA
ncbi:MAG: NlpC/P60 family protein [Gammaproteobacteria bacterium]|nr:NlpC/P60 family protein [Gammaproteobacteria bacterium]